MIAIILVNWKNYNVDYVLYNDIKYEDDKLVIEGLFFNTLSGGLISRRMINVSNYEDRIFNEVTLLKSIPSSKSLGVIVRVKKKKHIKLVAIHST